MKWLCKLLGYERVPIEVVQLSMKQEDIFNAILGCITNPDKRRIFKQALKAQQEITKFLRSLRK